MSDKRDPLNPIIIGKRRWFYIEKGGLHAFREVRLDDGSYDHTQDIVIPWATIEAAIAEHKKGLAKITRPRKAKP